ncbi:MAG: hypothetical protein OQJ97_01900 [Rhodospirillales bacterium]|nr:hypothetical protein [Rhodospirillales bacterium]
MRDKLALRIWVTAFLSISVFNFSSAVQANDLADAPIIDVSFAVFEYPPLYHTAKNGQFSGVLGETFKALCKTGRLNCTFTMYPVPRAYKNIKEAKNHVLITGNHPRFSECCIHSDWNYTWTSGLFSEKPIDEIPETEDGLIGDYLAVVRGWIAPFLAFPNLRKNDEAGKIYLSESNSNYSAIKMLDSRRATYLYGAEEFYWFFEKMGLKGKFNFRPFKSMPLVLWVPKIHKTIQERLNKAYTILVSQGALTEYNVLKKELLAEVYMEAEHRNK